MTKLESILIACMLFLSGMFVTYGVQNASICGGCPLDDGDGTYSSPGNLNVAGTLTVGSASTVHNLGDGNHKLIDDIETLYGSDNDLCIGYDASRDHLSISNGSDCGANKLFEVTDSSIAVTLPFGLLSKTIAELAALSPPRVGMIYFNSGTNTVNVSTGTGKGQLSEMDGTSFDGT